MAEIEQRSLEILNNITQGLDFSVPDVDFDDKIFDIPEALANALQKVPEPLTIGLLTECKVDGTGCFDKIMTACKAHLLEEFKANRITGAEYTKAYTAMMQSALQFAVQYLLGKDNAYYQALGTQAQALAGNIDAYTAKVRLAIAQAQAHITKAQYANQVLGLSATEKQTGLVAEQTNTQVKQQALLHEQTEQAHAQVSDTQLDGSTLVTGYTGNQNKLLQQQVTAFKKDAIVKAAKIYSDSFATQLSMSTATVEGTGLDANGIGIAMGKLQASMEVEGYTPPEPEETPDTSEDTGSETTP